MHEAAANSDLDLIALLNFDENTLLAELVHAFGLAKEQNLHLLFLWVRVEVIGEGLINLVAAFSDVDRLIFVKFVVFFEELLDLLDCLLLVVLQIFELLE